jgi:hypothetical protein
VADPPGRARALVTDHGSVRSHPAIISREYGVPAVLATSTFTDGQLLTVDGTTVWSVSPISRKECPHEPPASAAAHAARRHRPDDPCVVAIKSAFYTAWSVWRRHPGCSCLTKVASSHC